MYNGTDVRYVDYELAQKVTR